MKRASRLFEQICDIENLKLAWLKARKQKTSRPSVINFSRRVKQNLEKIKSNLESENPKFSRYIKFKIYDPKERTISVVPFYERVMHHALINVLDPVFERQFIFHTYACRRGKGLHSAIQYLRGKTRNGFYFLKLDIKKYFDSVDHQILKIHLSRIIKDEKCLNLLYGLIDSYSLSLPTENETGLPIGNLTSQYFANFYLSGFDHFVIEKQEPHAYVRYMDDMVIVSPSMDCLKLILSECRKYLSEQLNLKLKFAIFGKCTDGIPFLGRLVKPDSVEFLRNKKKRKLSKIKKIDYEYRTGLLSQNKACERIYCVMNEKMF